MCHLTFSLQLSITWLSLDALICPRIDTDVVSTCVELRSDSTTFIFMGKFPGYPDSPKKWIFN